VVATAGGSLLVLALVISTPGLSQLFGCTPVGPLGWGQGLLAAAAACLVAVLAPDLLARASHGARQIVGRVNDFAPA